GLVPPADKY
nr:RecName: Full=70 kDa cell wall protein [Nicotiana tabacum]